MADSPSLHDVGFLIKLVHDALDRTINRELESVRLTNSQLAVLTFFQFRGDANTTIRDIQEYLNVSHPTAAGLVKRLEQKGFVHLLVDPDDKRARIVRLTDAARAEFATDTRSTTELEELMMKGLDPDERNQLRSLLLRVYQNIKSS